ncbi:MAG: hypothetical protein A3H57_04780 [Candidatus Taylorbacteria bacterium RIFCSPLOWO2_02_FULL_43_11]|uniref:CMP/dCMP-type deaminase domain-containing protein n=1 Tax=Candidatus Taylorbacteria bacterium RIFCSPHIGHO2_02_FULL_43_32b TaxID=1802306 RepID=A0A1G2MN27_9BACT|nr:MAG: hypothetical protein A2743_03880 [Candidatus Taylorbacteria bacterium RIFCSPHIGHO2_01_FULL_43_47]OHA24431.1 MAG: hypothetical protein A3C72_01945 [Candidatus Taylorbacteria bacterium RIFCSPHIGHO2_02_FULL_43_32b]OHA31559.1 MAG: hypothetical protein A3B08_04440 [Candidatus Taylorbacteria bacterium RIFCSPLOWO2_01_FULL_43_44]OHA35326.1 MAG: hypothetical protein A3H57_04780 [Candidatus Taylorbacteria bacterium RIFCSPLOWO2_02_FULL_43_11]
MKSKLIAFVPVIHKGYLDLFQKYPDVGLLGQEIIDSYTSLFRDLRVVSPQSMAEILLKSGAVEKADVLASGDLKKIAKSGERIVMVEDDVSRDIAAKYFKNSDVTFEKIFLRWGSRLQTEGENVVPPDRKITKLAVDRKFMKEAAGEAEKSSDWWRQIGAVIVKNKKVILRSHNRHLPTDYHLSTFGDPRSNFDKGERLDIYTSIHGESDLVAKAASKGISLKGTSIYVSTFPCSNCARLLAEAGVKKVFYEKGYSRLDAENVLNAYGVEIILVGKS